VATRPRQTILGGASTIGQRANPGIPPPGERRAAGNYKGFRTFAFVPLLLSLRAFIGSEEQETAAFDHICARHQQELHSHTSPSRAKAWTATAGLSVFTYAISCSIPGDLHPHFGLPPTLGVILHTYGTPACAFLNELRST